MRTMIKVTIPVASGNSAIKDGLLPKIIGNFAEMCNPESMYFLTENGSRMMCSVFDLKDNSQIPMISEPFFMKLNATIDFCPVMNMDDLKAGLAKI